MRATDRERDEKYPVAPATARSFSLVHEALVSVDLGTQDATEASYRYGRSTINWPCSGSKTYACPSGSVGKSMPFALMIFSMNSS